MLHIHHSNCLETLASTLAGSYRGDGIHPLTTRIIITESSSLARWMKNHFCMIDGIACLIDTKLPAAWLWKQARRTLGLPPTDDPLSRERMQWLIHAELDGSHPAWTNKGMTELQSYLNDDESGLKRWQLAGRIADVFDRYQYYRPKLVEKWADGQDDRWQARIWRAIAEGGDTRRVALMHRFLETLHDTPEPDALPTRLDLFAIHNLPPLLLEAYAAVARHIPVHLWLLAPTPEYWADLASPRQMARQRLEDPGNAALWQAGNPLLTQWGRQGQVFQDLLLANDMPIAQESTHFQEPARDTLLGHVQADIYQALDTYTETHTIPDEAPLPSIQVHVCHGPMRECQVLRDNLLRSLEKDASLQPEDIVVMVPEISRYAPYIKAVFGQGKPRLPFNLNDTMVADEHPLTRAFLGLLELPHSRFTCAEILGLMQIPEVMLRFGLEASATAELAELFNELHVYWGLDGEHKSTRLSLPDVDENTWHQAFQRLMAGYALGSDATWNDIAPAPSITAQGGEQATRFFEMLNTLRNWAGLLDLPRRPAEWAKTLSQMSHSLFQQGVDEDGRLTKIHETIAELEKHDKTSPAPLGLAAIRHWLRTQLETSNDERSSFYSGGITFCGLKPLRGVPFKVICLMGMQEQVFPRNRTRTEFDLMAKSWRHGDPNPAQEDRYLFLETLLAARKCLIISYTGRDIRKNDEIPPAVVVQELIDHIGSHYHLERPLITGHPLQAFSLGNYGLVDRNSGKAPHELSFDSWWLDIGKAIRDHRRPGREDSWPEPGLPLPEGFRHELSMDHLASFLSRPIRKFIQHRLKLYAPPDTALPDTEPFKLDGLQQWNISDYLLQTWMTEDTSQQQQRLRAMGMLPHGSHGELCVTESRDHLQALMEKLAPYCTQPTAPLDIDITLVAGEHWQITGRIHNYHEGHGIVHVTASSFKPRNLLRLWVEHLCLQVMCEKNTSSHLFSKDKTKKNQHHALVPVESEVAEGILKTLISLYEMGLQTPLPLLPEAAFAYAQAIDDDKGEDEAMEEAGKKLNSTFYGNSKYSIYDDEYYANFLLRRHRLTFDEACRSMAEQVMSPLVQHLEEKA